MKDNKHIQSFNEHQENLNISDVSDSKLQKVYVMSDENHNVVGVVSDFENENMVKKVLHKHFGEDIEITYNNMYKEYEVKSLTDEFDPYLIYVESVCYFI